MKTKVWIVAWGLKDGGAETLAREYARLVDVEAFEPTLVTMYPFTDTANYKKAKAAGLNILSIFPKRNAATRALRVLFGQWYVPQRLKAMIKKYKPNAIHINSSIAHFFAPIKKDLSEMQLLYTCHSEVDKHFFPKEENAVKQLMQDPGLRLVALHEDMRKELDQRFGTDNTVVIRNGVDIQSYRAVICNKKQKRESIGVPQDAYVVGHIGRFFKGKNHAFLLQVFRKILQKRPNAHLLLIGNGELQEEIKQKICEMCLEDRVTILSHRTDIPELLHIMDVMVFPSFFEGLSVVLVEAQASGLRCVVSDSINPANYLSETTIPVSLMVDAEKWADIALDETVRNSEYGNIEDYDMNKEICRLERLYQGKLDV